VNRRASAAWRPSWLRAPGPPVHVAARAQPERSPPTTGSTSTTSCGSSVGWPDESSRPRAPSSTPTSALPPDPPEPAARSRAAGAMGTVRTDPASRYSPWSAPSETRSHSNSSPRPSGADAGSGHSPTDLRHRPTPRPRGRRARTGRPGDRAHGRRRLQWPPADPVRSGGDAGGAGSPAAPAYPEVDRNLLRLKLTFPLRPHASHDAGHLIGGTGVHSPGDLVVTSAGKHHGWIASVQVNGTDVSLNLRDPGSFLGRDAFDTFVARAESARLADFIGRVSVGWIVAAAIRNGR
jgi:hypothetical protein